MSSSLAEKARDERRRRKLTQRQAADLADISHRAYQDFEGGKVKPQPANLRKIIAALALDAEDAELAQMTREEWPRETQVFLDMLGAYMDTMTVDDRMAFIHNETRRLFSR